MLRFYGTPCIVRDDLKCSSYRSKHIFLVTSSVSQQIATLSMAQCSLEHPVYYDIHTTCALHNITANEKQKIIVR